MGSRTWVKIYCARWLEGSIRQEDPSLRGIFVDLLALAGDGKYGDTGEIKLGDNVGLKDDQLADLLSIAHNQWMKAKKRLIETDRISIGEKNSIKIVNWNRYQSEYDRQKEQRQSATKSADKSAGESAREREKGKGRGEKENTNTKKEDIKKEGDLPDVIEELVTEFLKLPGWGNSQNDVEWLSEFLADFPGFSILHFKACRDHHLAKSTKHTRGAWKSRLRNWMTNETKWRAGEKAGHKSRELPKEYTPQREDYD